MLKNLLILLSLASIPAFAASELYQRAHSPAWKCRYTNKVNTNHFADGTGSKFTTTLARVVCEDAKVISTYIVACKAPGKKAAPEMLRCIEDAEKETEKGNLEYAWIYGLTADNGSKTDKYGRKCSYATVAKKDPTQPRDPMVLYRDSGAKESDKLCASPIACDTYANIPTQWLVACKSIKTTEINGAEYEICPNANDCINNALPLSDAFTSKELPF